ncbi:MAG: hypothetical protein JXR76_31890 [Deltaproteobacteria bacterium]|nr:hypothetical protein [Deltaproteobacteria bacterium]
MSNDQKNLGQTSASPAGAPVQPTSTVPAAGGLPGLGSRPPGGGLPGLGARPGGGLPGLTSTAPAGGLPGIGQRPAGGGLPGLTSKPAPAGGLPGIGQRPVGGGLPGMGQKTVGGGLPGMGQAMPAPGAATGGNVPDFIRKQQEAERAKEMARDPFATEGGPAPGSYSIPADHAGDMAVGGLGDIAPVKNTKAALVISAILGVVFFGIGYGAGLAVNQRAMLNKVLRDAWIIQYEMKELRNLHGEVQAAVNTALADARQKKFNKSHIALLAQKVKGNPFDARLFTDRNFKTLNPLVVQMMANLYRNWDTLSTMIADHRAATNNDEKALTVAGAEFQKLLQTQYGVRFSRDTNNNNALTANIVILGALNGDKVQIQDKVGGFSGELTVYNPEGADDKLTTEPGEYVIPVGDLSKKTILQNASQSHFNAYLSRLEEMAKVLKVMEEEQENMFGPLNDNCSREPVSPFTARGVDPEAEFNEYKANKPKGDVAAE